MLADTNENQSQSHAAKRKKASELLDLVLGPLALALALEKLSKSSFLSITNRPSFAASRPAN
jgi:hypothetical protein